MSINRVVLIGRLAKEPELKYTPASGNAVATFPLAVDRRKKEDGVDYIPVVVWGKQAEAAATYTAKGKLIAVSGRLQTRSYDAKDGSKRYVTEVIADEIQFIEWAKQNKTEQYEDMTPVDNSDIPF